MDTAALVTPNPVKRRYQVRAERAFRGKPALGAKCSAVFAARLAAPKPAAEAVTAWWPGTATAPQPARRVQVVKAGSLGGKLLALRKLVGKARAQATEAFMRDAKPLLDGVLYRIRDASVDDLNDCLQDAHVGLLIAMAEWDPSLCASFAYFAKWKIWGTVRTGMRESRLVRGAHPNQFEEPPIET